MCERTSPEDIGTRADGGVSVRPRSNVAVVAAGGMIVWLWDADDTMGHDSCKDEVGWIRGWNRTAHAGTVEEGGERLARGMSGGGVISLSGADGRDGHVVGCISWL